MTRYVVTGGAGFIGSNLVRALTREPDARVEVIDNFLTGNRRNLEGGEGVAVHEADVRDEAAMNRILNGADVVFHLAAIPSVPRSIIDPDPSHDININGTYRVLRACHLGGVKRVVYAASSSAYGDTPTLPKAESMAPSPLSPYAAQKLMGELYVSVFHSCFSLDATALRFFNVYGPRQDPSSPYSGVISIFLKCLVARGSPTIHGDGEQTRDFTYVEDVAALCIKASRAPGIGGRVFNAGNGERFSLNLVWKILNEIEGTRIPALYGPGRAGDVRDSLADATLARSVLGHDPAFSLEDGLRRTLAWFRAQ
jgi:UDP-glucose 4-epimerase